MQRLTKTQELEMLVKTQEIEMPFFEINSFIKVTTGRQKFFIELTPFEISKLTTDLIKQKIQEKINVPVDDQLITIEMSKEKLSDNEFIEKNTSSEIADEITVHLNFSKHFKEKYQEQKLSQTQMHNFHIQLEGLNEFIELSFSEPEYRSPNFLQLFKNRLFEQTGVFETVSILNVMGS